jgi:D-alanyl-lipoteichoic acid acyltransferase DltB (MBOAT superfamily)
VNGLVDLIRPELLPAWVHPAALHDLWIDWRVRYPGPPAEFLLICLLSLLIPRRAMRSFFLWTSLAAIYFYFGVAFAGGLLAGSLALWAMTEALARWSRRRGSGRLPTLVGAVAVHAGTIWMFWQTLPGVEYLTRDETMGKGELWLFCGVAFTVLRAVCYVRRACAEPDRRRRPAEAVLYLLFFPLFRMGPIVGVEDFFDRLDAAADQRCRRRVLAGLGWFALGCTKLAIGAYVIELYFRHFFAPGSRPLFPEFFSPDTQAPFWAYWVGVFLFAGRIYCIFAGYADLARGMCEIIGMPGPVNFDRPFSSLSLKEFWARWHVSFGLWVRDSIYIPLGGNRKHPTLNSALACLYGGLWHFPGLNAVLFAVIHTLGGLAERAVGAWWSGRGEARRLGPVAGGVSKGLRAFWVQTVASTAGACVFDWYHGGVYLLRGMFGL